MAVQTEKVLAGDLAIGMYVSGLDRPWIDTDYLMEGFYIETEADLKKLQALCKYVYIDVSLSRNEETNEDTDSTLIDKIKDIATTDIKDISFSRKNSKSSLRNTENQYKKSSTFTTEIHTANRLYKDITITAKKLFSDIHAGKTVDLDSVRRSATAVVDSVVRNPDAFLWLTRLHQKDTHTHNRSLRTSIWAIAFARYLGLEKEQMNNLSTALLLCNIGKAKLPIELLEKEDELNKVEQKEYQKHVDLTLEALKIMGRTPQAIITIIRAHCERYDGSGYPMQLIKDEIPLLAQIAGLVSFYEEITNRRNQSKSLDPTRAVEYLYQLRNKKFQTDLIEEFICSMGIYPVGSIVELNSKEIAVIVEQNSKNQLLPQVLILRDSNHKAVKVFKIIDLLEIEQANPEKPPKIINTYAIGEFGIDVEEINQSLNAATSQENTDKNKSWNLKSLFKKVVS